MNKFITITLFFFSACGSTYTTELIPGPIGPSGIPGNQGNPGLDGVDGLNSLVDTSQALSCPNGGTLFLVGLDVNRNNILDSSEVQQSGEICNGTDGEDATQSEFTPVELIDPCGKQTAFDEVLVRLASGSILASFSQNGNALTTRFVVLTPGNYQTTDGTSCVFTVHLDGGVSW